MKNKSRKKKGAVPKINPLKVLTSIPGLIKGVIGIIVIVLIVFNIKNSIDFSVSFYNYHEPSIYPCL